MLRYAFLTLLLFWSVSCYAAQGDIISIAGATYPATSAEGQLANHTVIGSPEGIAIDASGNIYFSDFTNHQVKKIDRQTGILSIVAGTGTAGYSGDGGLATQATLNQPTGLVLSSGGDLFISDYKNHVVRKVNMLSGIISTVVGVGVGGSSGDGGLATQANLYLPMGLAFDSYSNLYISDYWNHKVRKVDAAGIITTFAGTLFGFSGDGNAATLAKLYSPTDVAVDSANNVYIADYYNNRIRKVDTAGVISTFAGNGSYTFSGDGGLATLASLKSPYGVAIDGYGNVLISDYGNQRIRRVDAAGVISTVAGSGSLGFYGDGGQATLASLYSPKMLAVDKYSNIFVPDSGNKRIRMLGDVLNTNTPASTSFPVVDGYAADNYFQSLQATNVLGQMVSNIHYTLPSVIVDGSYAVNVTYAVPVFASDGMTGGMLTINVDVTYNPIRLENLGVIASPPDKVDILLRAYDSVTGYPVTMMAQNDFIVQQDYLSLSVESKVAIKKVTELQHLVQTVIMFDVSSSITNADLQTMKQSVKNALIDPTTGLLRVKDQQVAIYAFDDAVTLIQDFTSKAATINTAIDSIVGKGVASTNFYGAIIDGMARVKTEASLTSLIEGHVVIITDGRDTSSYFDLYAAKNSIKNNTLHIIGVQSPDINTAAINYLTTHYTPVASFAAVESALTAVGTYTEALANSFYQVYYNSPARAGVHTITVNVVKQNTYYSPPLLTGSFDAADFYPPEPIAEVETTSEVSSSLSSGGCLTWKASGWYYVFMVLGLLVLQGRLRQV